MTRLTSFLVAAALASVAQAHFQLQFPPPRGPFVEDDEPNFCDGYTNAVSNRSEFPLSGGFVTLNSEHPSWTLGVFISTEQNPNNFGAFNTTSSGQALPMAHPFFQASGEGPACIPLDIGALNISGVQSGTNVSLEFLFDGGDGQLYQCTDITLSSSFAIPSNISCTHEVGNLTTTNSSSTSSSTSTSSTSSPSSSTTASAAGRLETVGATGLFGLLVAIVLQIL